MPITRARTKARTAELTEQIQTVTEDFSTDHTVITPKKSRKKRTIQDYPSPVFASLKSGVKIKRLQSTLDLWTVNSSIQSNPTAKTLISSVTAPTLTVHGRVQENTIPPENARSKGNIRTENLSNKRRKLRETSRASSDSSLPNLKKLLSASPGTQERIDAMEKRRFNYKPNKKALPDHALQTERLLSQQDFQSLQLIKDRNKRKKRENKLIRQQAAINQIKVMWMGGDIARWRELWRRVRRGDDSDHGSWNSRRAAARQLGDELEGRMDRQEGDDSD